MSNDGLDYFAGFVCFKTGHKVADNQFNLNSWVAKIPDDETQAAVLELESIFKSTNGPITCDQPGILERMLKKAETVQISHKQG